MRISDINKYLESISYICGLQYPSYSRRIKENKPKNTENLSWLPCHVVKETQSRLAPETAPSAKMAIEHEDIKLESRRTIYGSYEKLPGKPAKRQSQLVWVSLILGIGTGLGLGWMFGSPAQWNSTGGAVTGSSAFFEYFLSVDPSIWKIPSDFQKTCIPKYAPGANGTEKCAAYCLNGGGDHVKYGPLGLTLQMDNTANSCSESYKTAYGTAEVQTYERFLYGDFSAYLKAGYGRENGPGSSNAETCFALFGSDHTQDLKQE
eukprot:495803-Amorphochlora_amoeboformis.AAC.1